MLCYLFPPTHPSLHKPPLRIIALFVIYEQIALQSTSWIYADSSWDQFNSGWGRGEKKALAAAFPLHGKSQENETEACESAETRIFWKHQFICTWSLYHRVIKSWLSDFLTFNCHLNGHICLKGLLCMCQCFSDYMQVHDFDNMDIYTGYVSPCGVRTFSENCG